MAGQDQAWCRLVVVELSDEGGKNLFGRRIGFMLGIKRPIAPVLSRPEKEDLNAGAPAFGVQGDYVSVF